MGTVAVLNCTRVEYFFCVLNWLRRALIFVLEAWGAMRGSRLRLRIEATQKQPISGLCQSPGSQAGPSYWCPSIFQWLPTIMGAGGGRGGGAQISPYEALHEALFRAYFPPPPPSPSPQDTLHAIGLLEKTGQMDLCQTLRV